MNVREKKLSRTSLSINQNFGFNEPHLTSHWRWLLCPWDFYLALLLSLVSLTLQFDSLHWTTPTHSTLVLQLPSPLHFFAKSYAQLLPLSLQPFALSPLYPLRATKWKPTRSLSLSFSIFPTSLGFFEIEFGSWMIKASAKRFRVTGRGKIVRRRAGKQHLLVKKNTKRKLRLSKMVRSCLSYYPPLYFLLA